jgi:hypothetical protein
LRTFRYFYYYYYYINLKKYLNSFKSFDTLLHCMFKKKTRNPFKSFHNNLPQHMPTNKQKKPSKLCNFCFTLMNLFDYYFLGTKTHHTNTYFFKSLLMFHGKLTSGHQHDFLSFEIQEANESSNYTIE